MRHVGLAARAAERQRGEEVEAIERQRLDRRRQHQRRSHDPGRGRRAEHLLQFADRGQRVQVEAGAVRRLPVQPLALGRHPQDAPRREAGAVRRGQAHRQRQPVGAAAVARRIGHRRAVDADHQIGRVDRRAMPRLGQRPRVADQRHPLPGQRLLQRRGGDREGLEQALVAKRPGGVEAKRGHRGTFRAIMSRPPRRRQRLGPTRAAPPSGWTQISPPEASGGPTRAAVRQRAPASPSRRR